MQRNRKNAAVVSLTYYRDICLKGLRKTINNLRQFGRCLCRDSNQSFSEYQASEQSRCARNRSGTSMLQIWTYLPSGISSKLNFNSRSTTWSLNQERLWSGKALLGLPSGDGPSRLNLGCANSCFPLLSYVFRKSTIKLCMISFQILTSPLFAIIFPSQSMLHNLYSWNNIADNWIS